MLFRCLGAFAGHPRITTIPRDETDNNNTSQECERAISKDLPARLGFPHFIHPKKIIPCGIV